MSRSRKIPQMTLTRKSTHVCRQEQLTQAEVEARIADGQVNAIQDSSNRSVKDIVMGNTLTFFNFINIVLLALVLSVRSYKNMLFIFIIIANTLIGIFQEIKAKITLDKLKILTVSHVDVIRDGVKKSVTVSELVKDDVILLKSGGQIPADGVILDGEVDVNESLLTGESAVRKLCDIRKGNVSSDRSWT